MFDIPTLKDMLPFLASRGILNLIEASHDIEIVLPNGWRAIVQDRGRYCFNVAAIEPGFEDDIASADFIQYVSPDEILTFIDRVATRPALIETEIAALKARVKKLEDAQRADRAFADFRGRSWEDYA
jgi:uncharacterized small protein (DUF1192 family)